MINPANHPLLVHCTNGIEVTGLLIMCLRKLQLINLPFAIGEFLRFVKDGIVSLEETEFVENFRSEITIPETIPRWLWEGDVNFATNHPSIRLKVYDRKMQEEGRKKDKMVESNPEETKETGKKTPAPTGMSKSEQDTLPSNEKEISRGFSLQIKHIHYPLSRYESNFPFFSFPFLSFFIQP